VGIKNKHKNIFTNVDISQVTLGTPAPSPLSPTTENLSLEHILFLIIRDVNNFAWICA